jgi:hypothetical protein
MSGQDNQQPDAGRRAVLAAAAGLPAMALGAAGAEAADAPNAAKGGRIEFEDYLAILELLYGYADRIDASLDSEVPGLPKPDPEKRAYIVYPDTGTPKSHHMTTNLAIHPDGPGRAEGYSYFTVFQATETLPLQPIITGYYHDRFEKKGGAWRFAERKVHPKNWGELSQHLTNAPPFGKPYPGSKFTAAVPGKE